MLTEFIGTSMLEGSNRLPDYAQVRGHGCAGLAQYYKHQAARPESVAQAIIELVDNPQPPLRCVVGEYVQAMVRARQATWPKTM